MDCYDGDFDDLAPFDAAQPFNGATSIGTAQSMSSRPSVRSESVAGDEDWNVVIQSNDDQSADHAIQSAKKAGIPLPENVPTSALLGGTIKRLGKSKSKQKIDDDWDHDIDMTDKPLTLKPRTQEQAGASGEEMDDFDDLEGSLGIRFAGTTRDGQRARSSSASLMSPSLGSATADSEVDDFMGLELPEGPMDFDAILKKRRAAEAELSDLSQPSSTPALEQPATMNTHKKSKLLADDQDDFLNDFDLGIGEILDVRKRTTNRNVQVKSTRPAQSGPRAATTLNFHDKPTDKPIYNRSHIPRPVSGSKQGSRLEPVFESGIPQAVRERRHPTTTSAQLLRSKRSMPVLRSHHSNTQSLQKPPAPFLSAGVSNYQSPHVTAHRAMPLHLRRDSDPNRQGAQSPPPPRPSSRLANQVAPDTPSRGSRQRQDAIAPASLAREAASKRTLTKPARKRNFGDGSELEIFDDLPTSTAKEHKFTKQPVGRGPPKQGLRRAQSRSDFWDAKRGSQHSVSAIPERMMTPAPPKTPSSPTKGFYEPSNATPGYLRDTASSRIARESTRTVNQPRPRSEGPLQPLTTNWKAQVAARSPYSSPSAQRQKSSRRPALISGIGSHLPKSEKGMIYNPQTLRWEGNENTLEQFDIPPLETPTPSSYHPNSSYMDRHHPTSTSPSRPALIAHVPTGNGHNVMVQNGMVYDPQQMKWLKVKGGRDVSSQLSPSVTDVDEEDAFAGIDDLQDENTPAAGAGGVGGLGSPASVAAAGAGEMHEEFDLGPRFIRVQQDEEAAWRRRCDAWFINGEPRPDDGLWRRAIRAILSHDSLDALL